MIAYFDTSAIIPLIIEEPSSPQCERLWNDSGRVLSVRLLHAEAGAALGRAERMGRINGHQLTSAVAQLESLLHYVDHVEVTKALVRAADGLAREHSLRGYDAVHLAAALSVSGDDLVLVTGDADLAAAAITLGLGVAVTD